jgi:hypothetical protein
MKRPPGSKLSTADANRDLGDLDSGDPAFAKSRRDLKCGHLRLGICPALAVRETLGRTAAWYANVRRSVQRGSPAF